MGKVITLSVAGLGILIYVGLGYAEATLSGYSGRLFALLSNVLAALFLFRAYRLLRSRNRGGQN